MVDAIYTKAREDNRVRSKGLMIAVGVNAKGDREALGFQCADSETEAGWADFFNSLKDRGLAQVDMIISDSHKGLVLALKRCFQGTTWQRCQTHFSRNVLDVCPKKHQPEMKATLKSLYESVYYATSTMVRDSMIARVEQSAPRAVAVLEEGYEDVLAVLSLPLSLHKRFRTTNGIERVNEEIRRRERVIRIFPNQDSLIRPISALLIEMNDSWQTGRAYLKLETYPEETIR
jgi:transposase-like protein